MTPHKRQSPEWTQDSPEGGKVAFKFKIDMHFKKIFFFFLLEREVRQSQDLGYTVTALTVYIVFDQFGTMVVESVFELCLPQVTKIKINIQLAS